MKQRPFKFLIPVSLYAFWVKPEKSHDTIKFRSKDP